MPGVISQKRATRGSSKQAASDSQPPASSITSFTKLSKIQSLGKNTTEKKAAALQPRTSSIEVVLSSSRKRRAEEDLESKTPSTNTPKKLRREVEESRPIPAATPNSKKRKSVRFTEPQGNEQENVPPAPTQKAPVSTPSLPSRKRQLEADEPEALLERLVLQSPARKRAKKTTAELPQELLDLLDLQVAFLEALSVQYAHNGTTSPIDLGSLYPSITRAWGKRQVTLEDIQRCIGILNWTPVKSSCSPAPFHISDYGRSKICIDFSPDARPGPLRQEKLNMDFESNLRTLWLSRRDAAGTNTTTTTTTTVFVSTLPKSPIQQRGSLGFPVTKTQRTLEELKNGVVLRKQQEKEAKEAKAAAVVAAVNADGSKLSLLERIRLREAQAAQGVQGPTLEERQRTAALHRAEDVSAVIGMLCNVTARGQARVSFAMGALMTKLKDSLRTPISQEDGMFCVKLLAKEVAPQWLRVLTVGGREHVVVTTAGQPSLEGIRERVKVLLG
ncbi:hypothetical protein QBC42DRAFT_265705 [Cladorrhinum samala]|uniref:DNA replication factor Cdt1 C-terminal domain-containing protein n=1 Tax=Cladorrhinum samala TaxID=585594 RepID=A0AAV9HRH0_9PEZI|nr:hypothetical protein QBC42DRAFT_265705 [Cladorrhinum samala]